MGYRLFIDDERSPPEDGGEWVVARSSNAAIKLLKDRGPPDFISFDHDLGGDDTSIKVIDWLIGEMLFAEESIDLRWVKFPRNYYVHSQNPVGRKNIEGKMNGFIAYLDKL